MRRLIENELKEGPAECPMTPYQMAQELDLVGCIQDGAEDLAANARKYLSFYA
jgi:hypothetical protein